jgi:hypothetical protein
VSNRTRRRSKKRATQNGKKKQALADVLNEDVEVRQSQAGQPSTSPQIDEQLEPGSKRWKKMEQMEKRSVAVLIPCEDMLHTAHYVSMINMVQYTLMNLPPNLTQMVVQTYSSSILPWSRQSLAYGAVKMGATHTLWIDSDMMFPKDLVIHFCGMDEPIIGINAMNRRPPYRNLAQKSFNVPIATTPESTGLEEVYRFGFGVAWIATEVYKKMEEPWFDFQYIEEKKLYRGEDYYFYDKARDLGYKMLVDHDVSKQVWHIGTFGFNPMLKGLEEDKA